MQLVIRQFISPVDAKSGPTANNLSCLILNLTSASGSFKVCCLTWKYRMLNWGILSMI